jgi:hypothetical protein
MLSHRISLVALATFSAFIIFTQPIAVTARGKQSNGPRFSFPLHTLTMHDASMPCMMNGSCLPLGYIRICLAFWVIPLSDYFLLMLSSVECHVCTTPHRAKAADSSSKPNSSSGRRGVFWIGRRNVWEGHWFLLQCLLL